MAKLYEKLQVMVLSINTLQGHRGELKTQWTEFFLTSNPFLYILFPYRNSTIHSCSTEINIKNLIFPVITPKILLISVMFLKVSLTSYEDGPKEVITEQAINETVHIIRGEDRNRPAWHYILVSVSKTAELKSQGKGGTIDVREFGRMIDYRNNRGETKATSGWGRNPPKILRKWLQEHYRK
jgi:hypothetical protein